MARPGGVGDGRSSEEPLVMRTVKVIRNPRKGLVMEPF